MTFGTSDAERHPVPAFPPLLHIASNSSRLSMKQQIFINSSPQESRIAIMEDGVLAEFLIERKEERGIAGNIYKGKVERVLPGMQAAFVDIGMDKAAFLHASDFFSVPEDVQLISQSGDDVEFDDVPKPAPSRRAPSISASPGESRAKRNASDSKRLLNLWGRPKAVSSFEPPPKGKANGKSNEISGF